jgi:hypothetical protein
VTCYTSERERERGHGHVKLFSHTHNMLDIYEALLLFTCYEKRTKKHIILGIPQTYIYAVGVYIPLDQTCRWFPHSCKHGHLHPTSSSNPYDQFWSDRNTRSWHLFHQVPMRCRRRESGSASSASIALWRDAWAKMRSQRVTKTDASVCVFICLIVRVFVCEYMPIHV